MALKLEVLVLPRCSRRHDFVVSLTYIFAPDRNCYQDSIYLPLGTQGIREVGGLSLFTISVHIFQSAVQFSFGGIQ